MSILFHNKGQIVQLSYDTISYVMEIVDGRSEITGGPEIPCILRGGIIRNMTALSKMYPLMIFRLNIRSEDMEIFVFRLLQSHKKME